MKLSFLRPLMAKLLVLGACMPALAVLPPEPPLPARPVLVARAVSDRTLSLAPYAPFVNHHTAMVAVVDLENFRLSELIDMVVPASLRGMPDTAKMKQSWGRLSGELRESGCNQLGMLFNITPGGPAEAFFVVPTSPRTDQAAVMNTLQEMQLPPAFDVGNAIVAASPALSASITSTLAQPRPDLESAMAAGGSSPAIVAYGLSAEIRKALAQLFPSFPQPLGGGTTNNLLTHCQWGTIAWHNESGNRQVQVILQTAGAQEAQLVQKDVTQLLQQGLGNPMVKQVYPGSAELIELLKPQVSGNQLKIEISENDPRVATVVASLQVPADAARKAAQQAQSANNLKQIALAWHNYHDVMGSFPPPAILDANKRPLLSWRVAVLPYLDQAQLYQQFHLNEPWDSEHNLKLAAQMPRVYLLPYGGTDADKTPYLGLIGKGSTTVLTDPAGMKITRITDGTSNTIMVVEADAASSVIWTKPDDLPFDPQQPKNGLYTNLGDGFLSVFCDGAVHILSREIQDDVLRGIATPDGGEVIMLP